MSITAKHMMNALCAIVASLPIGTNLALLQFLWMLVTGALLSTRGRRSFPLFHPSVCLLHLSAAPGLPSAMEAGTSPLCWRTGGSM
jgi:hypothetical protein